MQRNFESKRILQESIAKCSHGNKRKRKLCIGIPKMEDEGNRKAGWATGVVYFMKFGTQLGSM
jgi:hypothetical protein